MELLVKMFGEGKDLNVLQMSARAVVIYFITLLLIRISGRRTFGKKSSFDITMSIILGAVLSRAIAGASPFLPTVAASLGLAVLHRLIAMGIFHSKRLGKVIKGDRRPLYKDGEIDRVNLRKCLMTEDDLMTDLRIKANTTDLGKVQEIFMENTGEISILLKE